ncbi:sensor histidine kinase [Actinomycetospora cinnamomea]|uniref:sensor histidine kinase n=1 Tax=Actinomycetospora cinnamomea TaxID=663609 RepID=UPI001402CD78|nr:sensor histidine kinase [Actinomycetospora cinnamomea]
MLEHAALFHEGEEGLVAGVVAHVRAGLEAHEAVVVALPAAHLELVGAALGDRVDDVLLQDVARLGRNPARLLPALHRFVDERPGRRVRAVSQAWTPDRPDDERAACLQHDALANLAFADRPVSLLCPYDTARLGSAATADARAAHPLVTEDGVAVPNPTYGDPLKLAEAIVGPLPDPPDEGETLVYGAPYGPRAVRLAVAEHAAAAGMRPDRVADLCLAVHEVAVNTVVHTEGRGILSLWHTDDRVVAEIQDGGHVEDPLVGRHPPGPADGRGYGLYLTHRLCDLVRLHSTRDGGTTVRITMYLDQGGR